MTRPLLCPACWHASARRTRKAQKAIQWSFRIHAMVIGIVFAFPLLLVFLTGLYQDHRGDVQMASRLTAPALSERISGVPGLQLVDVRNPGEAQAGMIAHAVNIPVGQLPDRLAELDPTKPTVVYCAGGYRSSVAASLLRQRGFADVSDLLGGYGAWEESVQNA